MKSIINIKVEKEVKENAQAITKELGISLSGVVTASLRNFIKTREVHFFAVPKMTEELEYILTKVEENIVKKENISPVLNSSKEVNECLDNL